ncbi:homoserine O-acetyltransferase/O-succinyltransferase family protein [Jidongwangia harbinensis]|uniref:homoserine O-acetyltransferase/O-succinyltransferase family protein n=1 Tax=Jidongwangia harbinensis TaxID=2878561 RepID=UPI001CD9758B|nr:homoserine O-succinyltransferase [Jidongwangia harbinensis]MCA2217968.1 homoserine O-succinyltransferase [Jidongwangia harbinensis]
MTSALLHPSATGPAAGADPAPRVGIVNLMPHAEQYERWLLPQFAAALPIDPQWIRVAGRRYSLDDPAHIDRTYRNYHEVVADGPLDGLVVTGAAVEHLPYDEVRFLPELDAILRRTAADRTPVLGLCWGALAVAHLRYGLPKVVHPNKVSGMYETELLVHDGPIAAGLDDRFWSAHSRFAGFDDAALDAAGGVRAVARSAGAGTVIAESLDHSAVLHIGHPEYAGDRLRDEYRRDVGQGRDDVTAPANVDLDRPVNLWRSHSLVFFASWVRLVHARAAAR